MVVVDAVIVVDYVDIVNDDALILVDGAVVVGSMEHPVA